MSAAPDSWKRIPFTEGEPIDYAATFSRSEFAKLREGLVPEAMEDKWFVYYDEAAYPVDSGFPRCSVLSDRIGAVARADTDGEGSVARGVPEVVSRRGELRGIFIQVALAGWFCVSRLWRAPRGWAEKPTAFA